jgi:hypothetical protein
MFRSAAEHHRTTGLDTEKLIGEMTLAPTIITPVIEA